MNWRTPDGQRDTMEAGRTPAKQDREAARVARDKASADAVKAKRLAAAEREDKPKRRVPLAKAQATVCSMRLTQAEAADIDAALEALEKFCLDNDVIPYRKSDMLRGAVLAFCRDIKASGVQPRHWKPIDAVA